jgi:hypothetical protein
MVTVPPPVDLLGHQQARLARLEVAVGVLSLSVLLLVSIGAWAVWHGLPIHYIPPGGPGVSQPGVIPDVVATEYASRWLTARYTFTPATVKTAHAAMLQALHPRLTVAFQAHAEREAVLVRDAQLSTQVGIQQAVVTQRVGSEVAVHLTAMRTIWVGGQQVREEPIQADLTVAPWWSQANPAGLVVTRIAIVPAFSAATP